MFRLHRRLVLHATRSYARPLLRARYASTETKSTTIRRRISDAIAHPATPLRLVYYVVAFYLTVHIFGGYFYSYGDAYGSSMLPTFNTFGDSVIISRLYRRGRYIQVGDLVSFKHPIDQRLESVKRVIGMPGDFVLRDTPGTSGVMMQVPEGHCWVVGDNLGASRDSRIFGPLPLALIKGKVVCSFSMTKWPHGIDRNLKPYIENDDDEVD